MNNKLQHINFHDFEVITKSIKIILDNNSETRTCCSCPGSCSDIARYLCFGGSLANIVRWFDSHPEFIDELLK